MDRRDFLGAAAALTLGATLDQQQKPTATTFDLEEVTITQIQAGMRSGKYTARALTRAYLDRIAAIDRRGPTLRSVIEINPDAMRIATQLDAERRAGQV